MEVCIIVPIYKDSLNYFEHKSLNQLINTVRNHPIIFVTHSKLNLEELEQTIKLNSILIETFDTFYFDSIQGYNELLLSKKFYSRFLDYEFLLIYQLDAFIFNDNINYWIKKDFDFVGAPWFENYGSYENGEQLWKVGNGGFCLRKTKTFYNLLNYKKPVFSSSQLLKDNQVNFKYGLLIAFIFAKIKAITGFKNNVSYFVKKNKLNEDYFLTHFFQSSKLKIKLPTPEEAVDFAFEKSPSYLYELNGNKLPLGCHAWEKYEYESFWKKFIK